MGFTTQGFSYPFYNVPHCSVGTPAGDVNQKGHPETGGKVRVLPYPDAVLSLPWRQHLLRLVAQLLWECQIPARMGWTAGPKEPGRGRSQPGSSA